MLLSRPFREDCMCLVPNPTDESVGCHSSASMKLSQLTIDLVAVSPCEPIAGFVALVISSRAFESSESQSRPNSLSLAHARQTLLSFFPSTVEFAVELFAAPSFPRHSSCIRKNEKAKPSSMCEPSRHQKAGP